MIKRNALFLTSTGLSTCLLFLSSCAVMPGIKNLDTTRAITSQPNDATRQISFRLTSISPEFLSKQKHDRYVYKVVPADVLNIQVWQHPEFLIDLPVATSNTMSVQGAAGQPGFLVNADGYIYFPLIGYVAVAGKTVDEIRALVTKKLEQYVPSPQVHVRVVDFRGQKVYVVGEVAKTGFIPVTDQRLSIADALSLSGWLKSDTADPRYIYVIRGHYSRPDIYWLNATTPEKLLLAEQFYLRPKDILFVSSAPVVSWNRVLNQLLPTIQTVWYTKSVVNNS